MEEKAICEPNQQAVINESVSKRMYDMSITALDFGYIVSVGCKRFALPNKKALIEKLAEYINDPSGTEMKYMNNGYQLDAL